MQTIKRGIEWVASAALELMSHHALAVMAVCLGAAVALTGLYLWRKVCRAEALIEKLPYSEEEDPD